MTDPHITYAGEPEIADVRKWLERALKTLTFAQIIAAVIGLITRMHELNKTLMKRIAHLQRPRPRSERLEFVERQMCLALGVVPPPKRQRETSSEKNPRRHHPGRTKAPACWERSVVENLVPTDKRICPECGCEMPTLGFSCCEQIEIIPAKIVVIERRDETVACANDDCIVSAAPPAQIVPKGKLGPTLIIEALADKYVEHQPIERQCVRFARAGVDIAPQTLGRAVAAAIDWMMPLAALIKERTSAPGLLGTDATSIPVLDRDAPEGIRLGTMWAWTNGKFVTFVYARSGDSDSVRSFLGDNIARTIQCDGSSVLRFVERAGGKLPGCWSHGRRRFIRAARGGDKLALEGVKIIDEIFAVERTAKAEGDDVEQIAARRRAYTKPILDKIRGWVDEHRPLIPPKTPLGKALGYMHRQWKRLELFIDDGRIESTNNRRERELRRLVLGRKNWLFVWGDLGGERAACALTVMASCVAHGVNPRAYLHRVIPLLVRGVTDDELVELLPDRITARYPELVPPPREPPRERLLPAPA